MAKTSADLIAEIKAEDSEKQEVAVKRILRATLKQKADRELWIKNRTEQIRLIGEQEKRLVKAFDTGELTDELVTQIDAELAFISAMKTGEAQAKPELLFSQPAAMKRLSGYQDRE